MRESSHLLFVPLSYLSPGRLRKQRLSPTSQYPRDIESPTPIEQRPADHLLVLVVLSSAQLSCLVSYSAPHGCVYRIAGRQTRMILHLIDAMQSWQTHGEAFVVQARLVTALSVLFCSVPLISKQSTGHGFSWPSLPVLL
jgi:hypothetical protein